MRGGVVQSKKDRFEKHEKRRNTLYEVPDEEKQVWSGGKLTRDLKPATMRRTYLLIPPFSIICASTFALRLR